MKDRFPTEEDRRLDADSARTENWKRWGPYLSERQWGTVREDYSADGSCWTYFPHEHAPSRAYRWGEDGLLGISDREGRLCFALALWNGRDPILKERLFGLTGPEGNHGEDVKELYYYLDSTPTHSYMRALYKYPQAEFPYERLRLDNAARTRGERELEILGTGVFDEDRYFDVTVEYAKAAPDDVLVRITIENRGPHSAPLAVLPTLWYRNTWSWGRIGEGYWPKPKIQQVGLGVARCDHASLGTFVLNAGTVPSSVDDPPRYPELLFTDNESNSALLWGTPGANPYVKDAFHQRVVHGNVDAVNPARVGTKAAALYQLQLSAGEKVEIRLRLASRIDGSGADPSLGLDDDFTEVFRRRISEADAFYETRIGNDLDDAERQVARQAYAGLLWTKQFYYYIVRDWLEGDPAQPTPPPARQQGRNREWHHLYNRDVISMPDKWEYPWYAAWDLAFHMIPFAHLDGEFAKDQLTLFLREWYQHPNGQVPAYEFAFGDVNPPVHAWACWRVYKMTAPRGQRDRLFLARTFHKLLLNFTWWVNRKDEEGNNIFSGGFLGLDNIGVFDRSKPLPTGGRLEQADGTAWMAFYCATMLSMALELASEDPAYEDIASKFFEHFVAIVDAINRLGGSGLWNEEDGFYYDQLHLNGKPVPLQTRSLVGIVPLLAVEVLEQDIIDRLPGFKKRMQWFLENRPDLAQHIALLRDEHGDGHQHRLLAIPSRERLIRVLRYLLDETEFLSPFGIRSVSRAHLEHPYVLRVNGDEHRVNYVPGESTTPLFGGNSNWRGPIWFPLNYLLIEALERYDYFYRDTLLVECPVGSGQMLDLSSVARELATRLARLFLPDANGRRPCHGDESPYAHDPAFRDLLLFYEYFHGDNGRGLGASHQTGWTALVIPCLEHHAAQRVRSSVLAFKPTETVPRPPAAS